MSYLHIHKTVLAYGVWGEREKSYFFIMCPGIGLTKWRGFSGRTDKGYFWERSDLERMLCRVSWMCWVCMGALGTGFRKHLLERLSRTMEAWRRWLWPADLNSLCSIYLASGSWENCEQGQSVQVTLRIFPCLPCAEWPAERELETGRLVLETVSNSRNTLEGGWCASL